MYEYEPEVKPDDYHDKLEEREYALGSRLALARSKQDRSELNTAEVSYCSVLKLWLETPGKIGPEDKALVNKTSSVPTGDSGRWHFAPKEETAKICWELQGKLALDKSALANPVELRIELFVRKSETPFWAKSMKWKAGECPKRGSTEFDGRLAEDLFKTAAGKSAPTDDVAIVWSDKTRFPDGVLTVDQSPFKVKLSIVSAGEPRMIAAKWVHLDILVDSLELHWGDYSMLPPVRPDITDPANLKKILGDRTDPLNVKKGFEEKILEELKAAKSEPVEGFVHEVKLTSNLFAFQKKQAPHIESYLKNTDFESYKALWGNGARIPLTVKAFIKKSTKDGKTDAVPEALGKSRILWDWEEKKADRWKTMIAGTTATKTDAFLTEAFRKNDPVKPVAKSNCPRDFGGKHGDASANALVFPEQDATVEFPFEVKKSAGRKWSSLSTFGTGEKRGISAGIFQPARFAGDAYKIAAYLHFESQTDDEADIAAPPPIRTKPCEFKVFRRINLNSLRRGNPASAPATLDNAVKTDYLKELDMVVEVNPLPVDNGAYVSALRTALGRVCRKEHFVDEIAELPQLSMMARFAVDTNPPPDSPGIVFRDWDAIKSDIETLFRDNSMRKVANPLANLMDEKVTGQTSGATGDLISTAEGQFILYPTGAALTPGEQVTGQSSNAVGALNFSAAVRSCWGHQVNVVSQTVNDHKMYKESIKIVFPNNEEVAVKYTEKTGWKKTLSSDLPESAKIPLAAAFGRAAAAHDQRNSFDINVFARTDSDNARERHRNLTDFLNGFFADGSMLDRKPVCDRVVGELRKTFVGRNTAKYQKTFALLLIGEIVWEYAAQRHRDEEGIFLLHIPGRYKGYSFADDTDNTQIPAKMPKVQGAVYPELTGDGNNAPFRARDRAVAFMATVSDGESDGKTAKTPESIIKHELAHALFLPHAMFKTEAGKITPTPKPHCHVKDDDCLMNYDLAPENFCGMCIMRLRGWNWKVEAFQSVTAVKILDGDSVTYLAAAGVQYTNLPKDAKWIDPVHTRNIDRLGRKVRVKVEFAAGVPGDKCYVQLFAHRNNAVYSDAEKGRKPSFNYSLESAEAALGEFEFVKGPVIEGQRDLNNSFFTEVELSPAVGDRYKIVAWGDDQNQAESFEIRSWRAMYYSVLRYADPQSVGTGQISNALDNTFLPNFTRWIFAGEVADPSIKLLGTESPSHGSTTTLVRDATNVACANLLGRQYPDLDPFLARIALISMCVTPRVIKTTAVVAQVGTGTGPARIQIRNQADTNVGGVQYDLRKGLYHNLGPNGFLENAKPLNPAIPGNQYYVGGSVTLHRQSATSTLDGRITRAGNARVVVTAAGLPGSPKAIDVPVALNESRDTVAGKIRGVLSNDGAITNLFDVGGQHELVILIKKANGAHDATLNIAVDNGTCAGLTPAPVATNTAAGVAGPTGVNGITIPIDFAAITPIVADPINRPGAFVEADVQVNNLMHNGLPVPQQAGTITIEVYVLNKFVNGMARLQAAEANGIIIMPAARDFKVNPPGGQLNAIIHELGHCMGMVANVAETGLDPHQFRYNHNGDHCSSGLARTLANDGPSYQVPGNTDIAGCVMFGFTSNNAPRTTFCPDCEAAMKRIDLSGLL
ncbi:MAG: hypothetical protein IPJ30_13950 [Acidobacteria bacterium]|nr:hypothetical protein [Acidobacteriota bacterium]